MGSCPVDEKLLAGLAGFQPGQQIEARQSLDVVEGCLALKDCPSLLFGSAYCTLKAIVADNEEYRSIATFLQQFGIRAQILLKPRIAGTDAILGVDGIARDATVTRAILSVRYPQRKLIAMMLQNTYDQLLPAPAQLSAPVLAVLSLPIRRNSEDIHQRIGLIILLAVCLHREGVSVGSQHLLELRVQGQRFLRHTVPCGLTIPFTCRPPSRAGCRAEPGRRPGQVQRLV